QAEDGIRDRNVTGVQTCALPIYLRGLGAEPVTYGPGLADRVLEAAGGPVDGVADFVGGVLDDTVAVLAEGGTHASVADPSVAERSEERRVGEGGRARCEAAPRYG